MSGDKPLQCTVTAKRPLARLEVAPKLISALRDETRISAAAVGTGVTISCIWYPDLDRVAELLAGASDEELAWSEPKIEYRYEAMQRGGATVEVQLEPILAVEVSTRAEFIGSVIGDLCSRRAMVTGQRENEDQTITIRAETPLAELRGYVETLNRIASGARASAEFHSYVRFIPRRGPPPDEPMSAALRA